MSSYDDVHMIDVSSKTETRRCATAEGFLRMRRETLKMIREGLIPKGDVLSVSQTAGMLAAKQTAHLIPLCHPLLPASIEVTFDIWSSEDGVTIRGTVIGIGRTGFEMEALIAVTIAALNLYDMCKNVEKGMLLESVRLVSKSGGKSGRYEANAPSRIAQRGQVVAVSLGYDMGPKRPVAEAVLEEGVGFRGDIHAGTERQVSLLALETVERFLGILRELNPVMMETQKIRIDPGDSAENLLIQGIHLAGLPIGAQLRVGPEAIIEVIQVGKEFHKPGFFLLPLEGVFGSVVRGGVVKPGAEVTVL